MAAKDHPQGIGQPLYTGDWDSVQVKLRLLAHTLRKRGFDVRYRSGRKGLTGTRGALTIEYVVTKEGA